MILTADTEPPAKLKRPDSGLRYHHTRIDLSRDTQLLVQRNVNGDIYITLGKNQATMILHPHAAARLIADMQAVMKGAEHAYD